MKSKENIQIVIDTRKKQVEKIKDLKLITGGVQNEFLCLSLEHQIEIISLLEWVLEDSVEKQCDRRQTHFRNRFYEDKD